MIYISLFKIQKEYLRYQDPSKNTLSENTEVRTEQPLASIILVIYFKLKLGTTTRRW